MAENAPSTKLKVLVIGESGVGKTSLARRYTGQLFKEKENPTVGVELKSNVETVENETVKLLLDMGGQDRFQDILTKYYHDAAGVMLVYDVTNEDTFNTIKSVWLSRVEDFCPKAEDAVKMIIGNKCDMESERRVFASEGEALAKDKNILFVETSAKNDISVEKAFRTLAEAINIIHKRRVGGDIETVNDIKLDEDSDSDKGCSCCC